MSRKIRTKVTGGLGSWFVYLDGQWLADYAGWRARRKAYELAYRLQSILEDTDKWE